MSTRGERIRQALEIRGVKKQQALAAELKVHESAITRWKEDAAMSLDSAVAFSVALDVSLDWLLLGRGTIDSHKLDQRGSDGSTNTYSYLQGRVTSRLGPKSIALLAQTIEAIADDISKPADN